MGQQVDKRGVFTSLLVSFSIFVLGTVVAAVSFNMHMLIVGRAFQGFGGGSSDHMCVRLCNIALSGCPSYSDLGGILHGICPAFPDWALCGRSYCLLYLVAVCFLDRCTIDCSGIVLNVLAFLNSSWTTG